MTTGTSTPVGSSALGGAPQLVTVPEQARSTLFLALAPLWASLAFFAYAVQTTHHFPTGHPVPWVAIADKVACDSTLYLVLLGIASRLPFGRAFGAVAAPLFLFAIVLDSIILNFGSTRFEPYHLELLRPEAIAGFLDPFTAAGIAGWVVLSALAVLHYVRRGAWYRRLPIGALAVGFTALQLVNPPRAASILTMRHLDESRASDELALYTERELWQQTSFLRSNDLLRLAKILLLSEREPETTLKAAELAPFAETIARLGLPLGRTGPAEHAQGEFDTILLVSSESLSLDLLAPYNTSLPVGHTPFFASIADSMFTDFRTTGSPTIQGMTAMFNSHPNFEILHRSKRYPNSVVTMLRDRGYETIHLRGCSRFYGTENLALGKMGFDSILGTEDMAGLPGVKPTSWWGVPDHVLFDVALGVLGERRGRKVFLHVHTLDTHPPHGRPDFDPAIYPAPAPDLAALYARHPFLGAVHRHDRDLGAFVEKLRSGGFLSERTLLVLTADHCSPRNSIVSSIPGYPRDPLCRIPFAILSGAPGLSSEKNRIGSQVDLAPTIADLAGLPRLPGWWGTSLFDGARNNPAVGKFGKVLSLDNGKTPLSVEVGADGDNPSQSELTRLYRSVVVP